MKEITFLKQNSRKWEDYEAVLDGRETQHPGRMTELFIELTDDLSYARSNYPQSKTTGYLNHLTAKAHRAVYRNKKETGNRFLRFWAYELPSIFGRYHNELLLSFIVTIIATLLGAISQYYDDSFVRIIMGDEYVNTTIERIRNNNPLGIYGENGQFYMFVTITTNNIRVSFVAFALGLLSSLGTAMLLIRNGIMLGSFFAMFAQYNVLDTALKVVWIHGALEISAIVIAGCAGFILGNSFMFPGTYRRVDSFKRGAKDGARIIIGLIPVFIAAGFLESFVTRYTQMPLWLSLIIIGSSMAFILWYFVGLPLKLTFEQHRYATKNQLPARA